MKSFKLQLMLLLAMLMATSSAFADVQIVAIPADSSVVDSLSKIELTFPEYENKVYDNYYKLESSTVTNDATGESAVTSTKIVWDNELGEYFLNCIPAVTVPGNYTVTIPEASFYFGDDNGYYNLYYEPFVLHYTVVGVNGSVVMVPADSARVDSLKTFTLTFSDKNAVFITSGKHSMLYKDDGTLVGQLDCSKDTVDNQITMTLPTAVTELDNYILQIPDSAFCFEDSIQGKYSLAMTFHYRVRVPLQVVAAPADSSVVQSLSEIGLEFPQYGYYFEYDYDMRNASTVTNDATGESAVTETELVYDDSDWELVYLKCTPSVTTPGNYTVTIPAGTFYFREEINNHELYDKPIVLHYTVVGPNGSVVMVPADSSIVDSLKTFTLTFSDKKTVFITKDKQPMLHIFMGGDSIVKLDCSKSRTRMVSSVIPKRDNKITMTLPTAVTAPGIYMLQIPDSAFCFEDSIQGEYSTAMTFYYMVEPPVQMVAAPADSSVVESLSEIRITLTSPEYDYADFADYNLQSEINIINDETEESAVESIGFSNDENNEFLLILNMNPAITTPGKYTMYIPAGAFLLGKHQLDKDLVSRYEKLIVLHYTVSQSTGISDVKVEGSLKGIRVNLNGQRVGDNYQGVVIENGVKRIMK